MRPAMLAAMTTLLLGILQAPAQSASGTQTPSPAAHKSHVTITPDQVKWGPGPPGLPPGSEAAVLGGDPAKPGPFVVRARMPDGYKVPPHWHPITEHVTVLEGTLLMGMGDTMNEAATTALTAGSYAEMPATMRHYVVTKGRTVIQISGTGPFEITYVDPKDDPRGKTTSP